MAVEGLNGKLTLFPQTCNESLRTSTIYFCIG